LAIKHTSDSSPVKASSDFQRQACRRKSRRKTLTEIWAQSPERAIHEIFAAPDLLSAGKSEKKSTFYRDIVTQGGQARALLRKLAERRCTMEQLNEPTAAAVLQLQEMLNTPIEHQAASYELNLLGAVLENGLHSLENSESGEETREILRHMLKSAFVIGRRHFNQLV
jgi:hypothetical protein